MRHRADTNRYNTSQRIIATKTKNKSTKTTTTNSSIRGSLFRTQYEFSYDGLLHNSTINILIVCCFVLTTFLICSMGLQHFHLLRQYNQLLLKQKQQTQSKPQTQSQSHSHSHSHSTNFDEQEGFIHSSFRSSSSSKGGLGNEIKSPADVTIATTIITPDDNGMNSDNIPHHALIDDSSNTIDDSNSNNNQNQNQNQDDDTKEMTEKTKTKNKKGKWAYAMLMAGVDPEEENGKWYRGILFNAMVVAELLHRDMNNSHKLKSNADVLLMVQFSKTAKSQKLSAEEEGWLSHAGVIVKYLPFPEHGIQNFYTIQFEKFRILQFTEYSRILFMDGDVMPYCSLDYLFQLSEEGILKENLVIAWKSEPSNGYVNKRCIVYSHILSFGCLFVVVVLIVVVYCYYYCCCCVLVIRFVWSLPANK